VNRLEAAFGTRDQGEILLRMCALLLRKVAQQDGGISEGDREAIRQALDRLTSACGFTHITPERVDAIAADASRDSQIAKDAVALVCGNTQLAELLLVELFRVSAADNILSDSELEWLANFADISGIPNQTFVLLRTRFGYDAFSFRNIREALQCLGTDRHARREDIAKRYRDLSKQFHPDRHPGLSDDAKKVLAAQFVKITDAYRLLLELAEEGNWCRTQGQIALVSAEYSLKVDCFFCESVIRLPSEQGVLATARCRHCKSRAVFPRRHAEELLRIYATREPRPASRQPKPKSKQQATERKPNAPTGSSGGASAPKPTASQGADGPKEQPSPTKPTTAPVHDSGLIVPALAVLAACGLVAVVVTIGNTPSQWPRQATAGSTAKTVRATTPSPSRPAPSRSLSAPLPLPPSVVAPPRPTPLTQPRIVDPIEYLLSRSMAEASDQRKSRRLKEAADVLRKSLESIKEIRPEHFDLWVQAQGTYRNILLEAAQGAANMDDANRLRCRREAAGVCSLLMDQYAKKGMAEKAEQLFAQSISEYTTAINAVSRAVEAGDYRPSRAVDREIAMLLQEKAGLLWRHGRVYGNASEMDQSIVLFRKVVNFCEQAFGESSTQATTARRNLARFEKAWHAPKGLEGL
jgi:DnaJ-domain-containing protein 1